MDMSKVLIIKVLGGYLSIVYAAPSCSLTWDEMEAKYVKEDESARLVNVTDLPPDRYFRNAWRDDQVGKQVYVDLDAAKEVKISYLREERVGRLKDLDFKFMLALEQDNASEQASIKQKKQKLRDLPVLAADFMKDLSDLEVIKNITIDELVV